MMALEDEIIKDLFDNSTIKFYVRYFDNTLVLAKASDINLILNKLNSCTIQIFNSSRMHEEFIDNNEAHFLDIKLTSNGTSVFRTKTHTVLTSIYLVSLHGHTKLPGFDNLSTERTKLVVTIVYYRMRLTTL